MGAANGRMAMNPAKTDLSFRGKRKFVVIGDIGLQDQGFHPSLGAISSDFVSACRIAVVVYDHMTALICQQSGCRRPNPAAGAGYDGDAVA